MKKEITGYAAFDKESGKGLCVMFGFTSNRTSLTNDPDKVQIDKSAKQIEIFTIWFNHQHKNQKEFEIKEVVLVKEIKIKE